MQHDVDWERSGESQTIEVTVSCMSLESVHWDALVALGEYGVGTRHRARAKAQNATELCTRLPRRCCSGMDENGPFWIAALFWAPSCDRVRE